MERGFPHHVGKAALPTSPARQCKVCSQRHAEQVKAMNLSRPPYYLHRTSLIWRGQRTRQSHLCQNASISTTGKLCAFLEQQYQYHQNKLGFLRSKLAHSMCHHQHTRVPTTPQKDALYLMQGIIIPAFIYTWQSKSLHFVTK